MRETTPDNWEHTQTEWKTLANNQRLQKTVEVGVDPGQLLPPPREDVEVERPVRVRAADLCDVVLGMEKGLPCRKGLGFRVPL